MKEIAKCANWLFYLSFVGVVLAAYGAFFDSDVWLAPTQWVEVTLLVVVYALYLKQIKK